MSGVFFIQQNFTVGDIDGNARLLIDGARQAAAAGADVALSPELSLCCYTPEDLLYFPFFQSTIRRALDDIAAAAPPSLALLVGVPWEEDGALYNAGALLRGGKVAGVHKKSRLPNYSVFDEKRYFSAAKCPPLTFTAGGETYAVLICEELWTTDLAAKVAATAKNTLVLNGSPFAAGKHQLRHEAAAAFARAGGGNVFYANAVGGQDELAFDGASFAVVATGELVGQLPAFAEQNGFAAAVAPYPDEDDAVYAALRLGLRDYVRKNNFDGVLLGLSGGVDSALVATLAVDALGGGKKVTAVMMPTQHTSAASLTDAARLAKKLEVEYLSLSPEETIASATAALAPHLHERDEDVTMENIQARARGLLLMGLSNNRGRLLLATGNKSEIACGYATLYGDMNGGFAPIKDVLKTAVWRMCRRINGGDGDDGKIPRRIITRPPSAELRPNQTDQDTLPPYEILDAMLSDHMRRQPPAVMEEKYDQRILRDFYRRLTASEYKRRQAPPGTRVSECAFGRDWRMPLINRFSYGE